MHSVGRRQYNQGALSLAEMCRQAGARSENTQTSVFSWAQACEKLGELPGLTISRETLRQRTIEPPKSICDKEISPLDVSFSCTEKCPISCNKLGGAWGMDSMGYYTAKHVSYITPVQGKVAEAAR